MSTDHRKPVVAFVVLAVLAAALVGIQRADARTGQLFASLMGVSDQARGTLPHVTWTVDEPLLAPGPRISEVDYSARRVTRVPSRGRGTGPAARPEVSRKAEARGRSVAVHDRGHGQDRRATPRHRQETARETSDPRVEGAARAVARSLGKARRSVEQVTRPSAEALRNNLEDTTLEDTLGQATRR